MVTSFGQPVVIENLSAAGDDGYSRVSRAPADGYTVVIGNNLSSYGKTGTVEFAPWRSFTPVALLPSVPAWIVTRNALPARNLKEVISWLRVRSEKVSAGGLGFGAPGAASAGIANSGSPGHICSILFQNTTGVRMQFWPYWDAASMLQGLVRGQVDFICDQATNSLAMVRNGQLKAHAVAAKTPWFAMPDIPTADDAGARGIHVSYWHGIWAPRGTPRSIVARLNAAAVDAMADAAVRRRLTDQSMEIPSRDEQTPEALGIFQRVEIAKWCDAGLYKAVIPLCGGRRADAN